MKKRVAYVQIPLPVRNFTTDWNDGRALGALVNSVAPGLIPDWDRWQPVHKVRNVTVAMDRADEYLGVTKVCLLAIVLFRTLLVQLIAPEELTNPQVDEYSVMTYLSQYPSAKLKPDKVRK